MLPSTDITPIELFIQMSDLIVFSEDHFIEVVEEHESRYWGRYHSPGEFVQSWMQDDFDRISNKVIRDHIDYEGIWSDCVVNEVESAEDIEGFIHIWSK
jgi:hypothetical protein